MFWVDAYDSGAWPASRIAEFFTTSAEFQALYGSSVDNATFLSILYHNALGRSPDQAGLQYWTSQLDAGMSRSKALLLFSLAPEFVNAHPLPSDEAADRGPRG